MHFIITGMNGTVAPVLAHHLQSQGHTTVAWDRTQVPTDNAGLMARFIYEQRPDGFFHVATGSPEWAASVARICAELNIKFLFTSSVSVFSNEQEGPFAVTTPPQASDDYGKYKREVEQKVLAANPQATIARLGWQIGAERGKNHMVDYLMRQMDEKGRIEASTRWYPSCAFLEDSAAALSQLMTDYSPSLYHIEGNPGLNFYEIVQNLNRLHGGTWSVEPNENFVHNQRMTDDRLTVRQITAHC